MEEDEKPEAVDDDSVSSIMQYIKLKREKSSRDVLQHPDLKLRAKATQMRDSLYRTCTELGLDPHKALQHLSFTMEDGQMVTSFKADELRVVHALRKARLIR